MKQRISIIKKTIEIEEQNGEGSLTQQAYERLQEMIVTLELKPGSMISEGQLSQSLGFGRTPVREAVQRLQQEQLLEIHRAQGILVPQISIVNQLKLLDVRRQLEPYVSLRAAKNANDQQRMAMARLAKQIIQSASDRSALSFMRVNRNIHAIKIEAAGNGILSSVMELFYGLSMRFWFAHYAGQAESLSKAGVLHAQILNAIVDREEEQARRATIQLMDFLEQFTRQTLGQ